MSTNRALQVLAGRRAAGQLAARGWDPDIFPLLLGASGGPKWLVLGQLDRYLFGEFLARGSRSLSAFGSSIGAWRHACLAQDDPVAALQRFEDDYLDQDFTRRPTPAEVSAVSARILKALLGGRGAEAIVGHPRIRSHIVTARGRGPAASPAGPLLGGAMAAAAIGNGLHRRLLHRGFQRVVFHSGVSPDESLPLPGFATRFTPLRTETVAPALHASGAIPFVLTGERDIPGAPPGQYWDGGIIDYHFEPGHYRGDGLILYPHFRPDLTPGWFDKLLPWRRLRAEQLDHLVLLCPSAEFVARLPGGKIPDRSDFQRLSNAERQRYWRQCIAESKRLADDFARLVEGPDPLAGVVRVS